VLGFNVQTLQGIFKGIRDTGAAGYKTRKDHSY
jgi:hypothetical protein